MSKRPETPDDLPSWDRVETLATFHLDPAAMKHRLLTTIDSVATAYLAGSRTEQPVRVESSTYATEIMIIRPRTAQDIARRLEQAQVRWDEQHPPPAPSMFEPTDPGTMAVSGGITDNPYRDPAVEQILGPEEVRRQRPDRAPYCAEDDGTGSACNRPLEQGACPEHGEVGPELVDDRPEMMPPPGQWYTGQGPVNAHHEQR